MSVERLTTTMLPKAGDRAEPATAQSRVRGETKSLFERFIDEEPRPQKAATARDDAEASEPQESGNASAARPAGERFSQSLDTLRRDALGDRLIEEGGAGDTLAEPATGSGTAGAQPSGPPVGELADQLADELADDRMQTDAGGGAATSALVTDAQHERVPQLQGVVQNDGLGLIGERAALHQGTGPIAQAAGEVRAVGADRPRRHIEVAAGLVNALPASSADASSAAARPMPGLEVAATRAGASRGGDMLSARDVTSSVEAMVVTRRETHFAVQSSRELPGAPVAGVADERATLETGIKTDPIVVAAKEQVREVKPKAPTVEKASVGEPDVARLGGEPALQPVAQRVLDAISVKLAPRQAAASPELSFNTMGPAAASGPLKILGLQLEPGSLGKVNVELAFKDGVLNVSVRTETGAAARKIEEDKGALGKALEAHGYQVDDIVVLRAELEPGRHAATAAAKGQEPANAEARFNSQQFQGGAEGNSPGQSGRQRLPEFNEELTEGVARPDESEIPAARDPLLRSGLIV